MSAAQVARDRATKEVSRLLSSTGGGKKVTTVSGSIEERVALQSSSSEYSYIEYAGRVVVMFDDLNIVDHPKRADLK